METPVNSANRKKLDDLAVGGNATINEFSVTHQTEGTYFIVPMKNPSNEPSFSAQGKDAAYAKLAI